MIEITDEQAESIINERNIPEEIINSSQSVAVILTQNWCPEWVWMKSWLPKVDKHIKVFYLSYNIKPYSYKLMRVKEEAFENDLIPYIRYYKNGKLVHESNYTDKESFNAIFK